MDSHHKDETKNTHLEHENKKQHTHSGHQKSSSVPKDTAKPWKIATAILSVLVIISLFANWDISISNEGSTVNTGGSAGANPSAAAQDNGRGSGTNLVASDTYDSDDPILGDPDAPITIVEFSDFECPFCARAYPTIQQIKENYVDTGKVKLIYRDFPLSFHEQAVPSALAAECAQDQGKFWEYHDLLFEDGGSAGATDTTYLNYAKELGLDISQFSECYESQEHSAEVQADFRDGQQLGVQGTPAFFINGVLVSGAQPYSVFEAAIEAALN